MAWRPASKTEKKQAGGFLQLSAILFEGLKFFGLLCPVFVLVVRRFAFDSIKHHKIGRTTTYLLEGFFSDFRWLFRGFFWVAHVALLEEFQLRGATKVVLFKHASKIQRRVAYPTRERLSDEIANHQHRLPAHVLSR